MRPRLAVAAALLFTLVVGWLSGASGTWALDRALQASALRGDLLEAHAALLGAQVGFCNADVGEMLQRLEIARVSVERAGGRLGRAGLNDEPRQRHLAGLGAGIDDARHLAARLPRGAGGDSRAYGPALPVKISEKP